MRSTYKRALRYAQSFAGHVRPSLSMWVMLAPLAGVAVGLALSASACGASSADRGCATDLDCKGARLCQKGSCVDVGGGAAKSSANRAMQSGMSAATASGGDSGGPADSGGTSSGSVNADYSGNWCGTNDRNDAVSFAVTAGAVTGFDMNVLVAFASSQCKGVTNQAEPAQIVDGSAKFRVGVLNAHIGLDVEIDFDNEGMARGSIPAFVNGGLVCDSPQTLVAGTPESEVAGPYTFSVARGADGCNPVVPSSTVTPPPTGIGSTGGAAAPPPMPSGSAGTGAPLPMSGPFEAFAAANPNCAQPGLFFAVNGQPLEEFPVMASLNSSGNVFLSAMGSHGWVMFNIPARTGTFECTSSMAPGIAVNLTSPMVVGGAGSSLFGGSCSVTVGEYGEKGQTVWGTFEASIGPLGSADAGVPTASLTDGCFQVIRSW